MPPSAPAALKAASEQIQLTETVQCGYYGCGYYRPYYGYRPYYRPYYGHGYYRPYYGYRPYYRPYYGYGYSYYRPVPGWVSGPYY